jgi:hypothetical protein
VKHGAVCGTSGRPGSEESFESMRGTLSKCEFRGTEIADRDEISDEMTSGDVGSVEELGPWPRRGSDLRRRRRLSRADSACWGGSGKGSSRCMAFNSSVVSGMVYPPASLGGSDTGGEGRSTRDAGWESSNGHAHVLLQLMDNCCSSSEGERGANLVIGFCFGPSENPLTGGGGTDKEK